MCKQNYYTKQNIGLKIGVKSKILGIKKENLRSNNLL